MDSYCARTLVAASVAEAAGFEHTARALRALIAPETESAAPGRRPGGAEQSLAAAQR